MLSASTLIALAVVGMVTWFWSDSLRVREQALRICSEACRQMGLQFLDQTVMVRKLGFGRDSRGRFQLRRSYVFEFSIDGADRYRGHAVMLGRFLVYLDLEHPDGAVIQGPGADQARRAGDGGP